MLYGLYGHRKFTLAMTVVVASITSFVYHNPLFVDDAFYQSVLIKYSCMGIILIYNIKIKNEENYTIWRRRRRIQHPGFK